MIHNTVYLVIYFCILLIFLLYICIIFLFLYLFLFCYFFFFFFQAEDGIRDYKVTGVQTCALPIYRIDLLTHALILLPVAHRDGDVAVAFDDARAAPLGTGRKALEHGRRIDVDEDRKSVV